MTNGNADRAAADDGPSMSVVVVGRDGIRSLVPILDCLTEQSIAAGIEVVAVLPAHACPADALGPWADRFHGARTVRVPSIGNRGRAAAAGVRVAAAPILAFTENHCFPDPDWAAQLLAAYAPKVAGVAPVVLNANPDTTLSRAIYGSGYAAFSSAGGAREIAEMPLHNTSYRRDLLTRFDNELEDLLSHESLIQARLRAEGWSFLLTPAARTSHVNEATWALVLGLNYFNGRRYGGGRAAGWSLPRRLAYAALFPALSVNVLRSSLSRLRESDDAPAVSASLLGVMWLQSLAHAAGEAASYLRGPRAEYPFVDKEEFMILERLGKGGVQDPRLERFVSRAEPIL